MSPTSEFSEVSAIFYKRGQSRRHPLWVAELREEILCLCVSRVNLLHVLV
jgi:hypothetical protein